METIESVSKWAEETFGPSTPIDTLKRAFKEIRELEERCPVFKSHYNKEHEKVLVEEAADVCITLYRYLYLTDPLAIEKKMAINRARKWKLNGDGTGQHE